jgi:membrane-associated protease RseP (regulator of RpoE activity)
MNRWITKHNIVILNVVLLAVFVITLIAVAVPFARHEIVLSSPQGIDPVPSLAVTLNRNATAFAAEIGQRLDRIVERSLFNLGIVPPLLPPPPPPPLRLRLVGVSRVGRGERVAIILDQSDNREYMLRVGDEVGDYFGVRITTIIFDPPSVTYNRPLVGDVTLTVATPAEVAAGAEKDQWSKIIRAVREGYTYVVKVPLLVERTGSVDSFLGTFGFEANLEGTRPNGLKITSLPADSFLYAAGLRQGDIVKTINESPITDRASLLEHLIRAADGSNARLGIVRGQATRTMYYALLKQ